jgi:hypothetical protein
MINLETSLSLASLGLIVMFVLLMYSFLSFLIGPKALGQVVQPEGVIIQIVSISAAPGIVLTGITFLMVKNYGSKLIGTIICASGIVLLIGIILTRNMIAKIPESLYIPGIVPGTYAILASAIGIIIIGIIAFTRQGKRKPPIGGENF